MGSRRGQARNALTVALVFLVLVLGVALLWVRLHPRRPDQAPPRARPVLAGLSTAAITAIEVNTSEHSLALEQRDGRWWVVEPFEDLARRDLVGGLLEYLAADTLRVIAAPETLTAYGLDPPWCVLRLHRYDGRVADVLIGAPSPGSGDYYALWKGSGGLAMFPSFFVERYIRTAPETWRETSILPPSASDVDSVRIIWPGESVVLEKLGREDWRFLSPESLRADGLQCSSALACFSRFLLERFPRGKSIKELGLDRPAATWIVYRGLDVDTIRIGNVIDDVFMAVQVNGRPPALMRASEREKLAGGVAPLEWRRPLKGRFWDVRVFAVSTRQKGLLLAAKGSKWKTAAIPPLDLDHLPEAAPPDTFGLSWEDARGLGITDAEALFALRGISWERDCGAPELGFMVWDKAVGWQWVLLSRLETCAGSSGRALCALCRGSATRKRCMRVRSHDLLRVLRLLSSRDS